MGSVVAELTAAIAHEPQDKPLTSTAQGGSLPARRPSASHERTSAEGLSMPIQIKEVASRADLRRFVQFPFAIYQESPNWIPPLLADEYRTLRRDKNPAFEHCEARYWLAYKDGRVAGRIAGIINRLYIAKWGNRYARFGWVDFVDDRDVVEALFAAVEQWAKEHGMTGIHGPLGFSDMDHEGMLVDGFDELGTLAAIYNHPYYPKQLAKLGYEKDVDWVEFEVKVPGEIPARADRIAKIVMQRTGVRVLDAKRAKDLLPYALDMFEVLNSAFADLYAFVPLTQRQSRTYIKQYLSFVLPDYTKILLDSNDKVAGFVIGMPSLSRALKKAKGRLFPFGFWHVLRAISRKNKYIDLYLGAIRPDLQGRGADALLMTEMCRSAIKNGAISAETNVELEQNVKVQSYWSYFESRQHKRRRCYLKEF
jgi:ribosomal protein S18 acetylase RimI-like enzyme